MKDAFELLRLLTERLPPRPGCAHGLHLTPEGVPRVSLSPLVPEGATLFPAFTLDEHDLTNSPAQLAENIVTAYVEPVTRKT